jgi:hypothetical protein
MRYDDIVKVVKSMWIPLEKYEEICESRSPKIVKILHGFVENYIIIHRNVKRLRDKLVPIEEKKKDNKLEKLKKVELEIRSQLYRLQEEEEDIIFGNSCVNITNSNDSSEEKVD